MADPRESLVDELLVLRAQAGSRAAFEALAGRWQERLWRHARRLVAGEDRAWDVLQESWLAIARDLRGLEDPLAFRRWAYTLVTRRAVDMARRDGARPAERLDGEGPAAPAPDDEREAAVDLLRRALGRLAPERRALVALRYLEGFDSNEIAVMLGVPAGTVRSRLFQARAELREHLEKMER